MEIQILDDPAYQGDLKVAEQRVDLRRGSSEERILPRTSKWNCEEIGASGSHITVRLNGHTIVTPI
jgi:hypothetical protein